MLADGRLQQTNCPKMDAVLGMLAASPYFRRPGGAEQHFLLTSINQPMSYYLTPQCTRLYDMCFNCTKLSIDVYPVNMFRELRREPSRAHKWHSIPFPSNFHYGKDVTRLPWLAHRQEAGRLMDVRPYSISFMGTTQVTATRCKLLREAIFAECDERPDTECFASRLQTHNSVAHLPPVHAMSRLCLMPGGDFPTRKAVLDALFTGCVPVLFQRTSAATQWSWHWGSRETVTNATVFMSMERFTKHPKASIDDLLAIARDAPRMEAMRSAFAKIAFRMQYSQLGAGNRHVDAVDVVLEHLLHQHRPT
jgi:hypothetical protein